MKRASVLAVPSLLLLLANSLHPLHAQARRRVLIPVGAHVKTQGDSDAQSVEGTILGWRGDTLLVQPQERADTVRIASGALRKLRIVESPALWRYTSPGDINFYRSAAVPRPHDLTSASGDAYDRVLVVGTKTELAAVNPATGTVVWTRQDLADLKGVALDIVGTTGCAVVTRRDTMEIIDLRTGLKRWSSAGLSFLAARGWLPSPGADTAIVMLGRTATSAATLMAVDVATGKARWRQDSAFSAEPKVFESGGVSYLFGNQSPYADSDTTLVLYLSTDGPIRLDARTGRVLWRGTTLRATKLPLPREGYTSLVEHRGLLFVPSGDDLLALHDSDGTTAWSATHKFKSQVIAVAPTARGLFVRGSEWFDLLDPATGQSLWHAAVELKNATWGVLRGDTDYVAGDKRAVAIGIADGTVRTIAAVDFKEGERPSGLTVWKQGLILYSWHNLMLVDRQGAVRYQHEYPSPKKSFGEIANPMVTDITRPTTRWAGSRIFFYTGAADQQGHEGFSVVEVDPSDGHELARLWFNGRVPWYDLDGVSGLAYYRRDDHTIEALPLLDGSDLSYAARNGQSGVVERLIAMGADAALARDDGWTALHLAALNGHATVTRLLLAHGASLDGRTHEGWTPWMLALREGHDSLARALRSGADSNSAAARVATGWRLAQQGRIPEALAELNSGVALDSTLGLWSAVWRTVCWNGSLAGQATAVLAVCDRAVERTPVDDDYYDSARLSRAIARALAGDLAGAATDLEANGSSSDDNGSVGRWIAALRQGRNPFTAAVLEGMRR